MSATVKFIQLVTITTSMNFIIDCSKDSNTQHCNQVQIKIRLQTVRDFIFWILNIFLCASLIACKKNISGNSGQAASIIPKITFQKTYDGGGAEWPSFVKPTKDGGYIITCGLQKSGTVDDDFYLAKTDSAGHLLWGKTFGGTNSDIAFSVQQTTDEGFIISGYTGSFGQGTTDVYLVRTDKAGKLLWSKTFGGYDLDRGWAVAQTSDGGFIVTGDSQSNWGTFLIKLNSNGNMLWTKEFGYYESGFSVQQTSDGGFIIGGQTNTGVNEYDIALIKTDINGNLQWTHSYGSPTNENGSWVRQTKDGGYIMAGTATTGFGTDIYIVRTDSTGNLAWSKTYGGNNYDDCSAVLETNDGGFIMLCQTFSYGNNLILVIKTNSTGNLIWSKTYGSGINGSIEKTADGGYIISATDKNSYLIKTDENGNSGCNESSVIISSASYSTQVRSPVVTVSTTPFISSTPATLTGSGGIDSTICYHHQ